MAIVDVDLGEAAHADATLVSRCEWSEFLRTRRNLGFENGLAESRKELKAGNL